MSKNARVLVYDIETSPLISYTWGIYDQNVVKVIQDWQILSVAWKWLGEKKVHCVGLDDFKGYKPGQIDDKEIVKLIHGLFDEADIVLAHNGDRFDQKKAQARMLVHGLKPPKPYKQIDTLKVARRYFNFTSNKLGDLAKQLGVSLKGNPGGFETWEGCLNGDKKAWKKMKQYNKQDIPPLEEIYLKELPWITNHPYMNVYGDRPDACPNCAGTHIQSRGLTPPTSAGRRRQFACMNEDCGAWFPYGKTIKAGEGNL